MSEQENIQIVRTLIDNLNRHDLSLNDQYLASDVKVTAPGVTKSLDRSQGRMFIQGYLTAFPDIHFDLKDIIAQGNKVAVSWMARGTHKGTLMTPTGESYSPTSKVVSGTGCTIYEFRNNMVVRQDFYWDQVLILSQLGIMVGEQRESRSMH